MKAAAEFSIAKGTVIPDSRISSVDNTLVTKKLEQVRTAGESWAR